MFRIKYKKEYNKFLLEHKNFIKFMLKMSMIVLALNMYTLYPVLNDCLTKEHKLGPAFSLLLKVFALDVLTTVMAWNYIRLKNMLKKPNLKIIIEKDEHNGTGQKNSDSKSN